MTDSPSSVIVSFVYNVCISSLSSTLRRLLAGSLGQFWIKTIKNNSNEPLHDKTSTLICAPSKDSDQPRHPPSLIRVFSVRSKGRCRPKVSSCGQQRLWSDWVDAHADLSLCWAQRSFEPRYDKTNKMAVRPAKTQMSLGIRPVWSESSMSAWRNLGSSSTHWAHSEDSDQTGRMPRLMWVFAGRTVILLVLSCRGSFCWFCHSTAQLQFFTRAVQ